VCCARRAGAAALRVCLKCRRLCTHAELLHVSGFLRIGLGFRGPWRPARRPGSVLSLVEPQERFVIQRLARRLGVAIPELQLSAGAFTAAGAGAADAVPAPAGAFTAAGMAAAERGG